MINSKTVIMNWRTATNNSSSNTSRNT